MNTTKALLSGSTIKQKQPILVLACLIVVAWICFSFYTNHTNQTIQTLSTQIQTLKQYQNTLQHPKSRETRLVLKTQLTTESGLSFRIMGLLHHFPSLSLVRLKSPPVRKKATRKKKSNRRTATKPALSSRTYLRLLPGAKVSLKPYHLTLKGPYRDLSLFLDRLMHLNTPLLLQQVTLVGTDYPVNRLTLDLAFFQ